MATPNINDYLDPQQEADISGLASGGSTVNPTDAEPGVVDIGTLEENVPEVPQAPTSNAGAQVVGAVSAADTLAQKQAEQNAQTAQEKAQLQKAQQGVSKLEQRIQDVSGLVAQKGAVTLAAQQEAGFGAQQKQIDSLNSSILGITNSIKQKLVQDEMDVKRLEQQMRGVPTSVVRGRQALLAAERRAERKTEAIELEGLTATSNLLQGQLEAAQKSFQNAIDLQFGDLEKSLENDLMFLNRMDSKEAGLQKSIKEKELAEIQQLRDERNSVFGVAEMASKNGAPSSILTKIANASTREEALAIAGGYGVSISDRIAQAKYSQSLQGLAPDVAAAGMQVATKVGEIDDILSQKGRIRNIVAPGKATLNFGGPIGKGARQDLVSSIQKQISGLTIDQLIQAKAQGATFGALSDTELGIIAAAATRIGDKQITNRKGEVVGYRGTPEAMMEDLNLIKEKAIKDYELKTGVAYVEPSFTSEADYVDALEGGSPFTVLSN